MPRSTSGSGNIPESTVARLPLYFRVLGELGSQQVVGSEALAAACGVTSAQLRKDLSYLGAHGTRGIGYDVRGLRDALGAELGLTHDWPVVIVGGGNLGLALANYAGFKARGFRVVGIVDADNLRTGEQVSAELVVQPMADLERIIRRTHAAIGIITTPAEHAQSVCDLLVAAGVTGILNFAPVVLSVPASVEVRDVDLGLELQLLAFHEQRRSRADGNPDAT